MGKKDRNDILDARSLINECDVIITDGYKYFIGMSYYKDMLCPPIVLCKYSGEYICFLKKIAEILEIPCIEDEETAKTLFEEVEPGDLIPEKLYQVFSRISINLLWGYIEEKKGEENFLKHLKKDVNNQIFRLEKRYYRRAAKKIFRSADNKQDFKGNVCRFFEDEVYNPLEKYGLAYGIDCGKNSVLFVLKIPLPVKDVTSYFYFQHIIFIHKPEQKIYIGTRTLFREFDFCEAENALRFCKVLLVTCYVQLGKDARKLYEEFQINYREYVIAHDSMKALLEANSKQTGKEYGSRSDTTFFVIYFKKEDLYVAGDSETPQKKSPKMYEIALTYKEFLRNPDFFRKFIANPHKMEKWNFWCRERKYNPEYFKEKAQTIDL